MRVAEARNVEDPTPDRYRDWSEEQEEYKKLVLTKVENKRLFKKQSFFGEAERVGHILALIVKANAPSSIIPANSVEIVNAFRNYYENLYSTSQVNVEGDMWDFFLEG